MSRPCVARSLRSPLKTDLVEEATTCQVTDAFNQKNGQNSSFQKAYCRLDPMMGQ